MHRFGIARGEVMARVRALHDFLALWAVHGIWRDFLPRLRRAVSLEELQRAHEDYADALLERALLHRRVRAPRRGTGGRWTHAQSLTHTYVDICTYTCACTL